MEKNMKNNTEFNPQKFSDIHKGEEASLEIACIYAHFQKTKELIQT